MVTTVAVNSNHARASESLFRARDCSAPPARAIYLVGGLRSLAHPIASRPSLVAYPFPGLGDSHGANALALSINAPRELAGKKGRRRTVPGRIPPALSRQAGLSGYFRNLTDSGWITSLRLQPCDLWPASLESPLSQPTTDPGLVARILIAKIVFQKPFFAWDHNHRDDADSRNQHYHEPQIMQPKGQSKYE